MKRFENILYVSEPGADETAAIERTVALARNNQARLKAPAKPFRPWRGN